MQGSNYAIRELLKKINSIGTVVTQGHESYLQGEKILEVLNCQLVIDNPRDRVFSSNIYEQIFNPGLAVARFFYLLSGSQRLKEIKFYTDSVAKFSDDGIVLPGSSYGYRIFNSKAGISQFDQVTKLITAKQNTKRAAISIYQPRDCGRVSKDIPCCMSLILSPREDKLHLTVHMRANNIVKLLPYNVFEFTLLFEFIANYCNYELGHYHHISTSAHISFSETVKTKMLMEENIESATRAWVMPKVKKTTRAELIKKEHAIRKLLSSSIEINSLIEDCKKLTLKTDYYWSDFFITLVLYQLFRKGRNDDASYFYEKFERVEYVLLAAQNKYHLALLRPG